MKDLEERLKRMKLKKVPESLDYKIEELFAKNSERKLNGVRKTVMLYIISTGLAASFVLVLFFLFFNAGTHNTNNIITETEGNPKRNEAKANVQIVKLPQSYSEVFGINTQKKLSFFELEKSTIARISIK